jgi:protein-tyrosine phosphatase
VTRICFVCLGNICRSPTAEAVMRHLVEQAGMSDAVDVESAGTGPWHVGEAPDARARQTARARGIRMTGRGQQFQCRDFARFDYVIAMDGENFAALAAMAPDVAARAKLRLLRSFDPASPPEADVPDPYYGGPRGFEDVLDICEAACRGLLAELR